LLPFFAITIDIVIITPLHNSDAMANIDTHTATPAIAGLRQLISAIVTTLNTLRPAIGTPLITPRHAVYYAINISLAITSPLLYCLMPLLHYFHCLISLPAEG